MIETFFKHEKMHPFSLLTLEEKFSDSTAAFSRNSELTALSRNKKNDVFPSIAEIERNKVVEKSFRILFTL